jgi:4-amino-4-deoxy-L-arabinose transferase-like glycosyltransferase
MAKPKSQIPNLQSRISSRGRLPFAICYLVFLLLGLTLRLAPLGRYVTPDEPTWVYRSIRFADALAARNWVDIPLTAHPGVTTMWLGTLGVTVHRLLDPAGSAAHLDWIRRMAWLAPENGEAFRHLSSFLPGARAAVTLATALGLIALYPLLKHLFDRRVALLTVGLLALDPFVAGHSGLLHTDGLVSTFAILALTAALNGLREPRRAVWWPLAGFFVGLALLSKTPALILLPYVLFAQFVASFRAARASSLKPDISRLLIHSSLFALAVALTCLALYPALWANPIDTFHYLTSSANRHIETVQRPIFFAGRMASDPGAAFYAAAFLFRLSPVVLIALVGGLFSLRRLPSERRFAFLLMLAFAVSFVTVMSLAVKKHDRYLLLVFPPLTLAASISANWYIDTWLKRINLPIYGLAVALQALLALAFLLYPLTYANPLAGGPWVAAQMLAVDWGEGMGAAARWLNQYPDAERLTIAAASTPSFAPLFKGHTVPLDRASLADYFVLDPGQPIDYPATQPAQALYLGFLKHAAIYTNTAPSQQASYLVAHAAPGDLIVLDANTPLLRHYTGPATLVSMADLPAQATVTQWLGELIAGHARVWLVADPAASPITARHLRQSVEAVAAPAVSEMIGPATITQYTVHSTQTSDHRSLLSTFGHQINLIDTALPTDSVSAPFEILLRWQVPAPTPTDLHFSLYLMDTDGHVWNDVGQLVLNDFTFPTSQWGPGDWSDQALTLTVPEHTPPGTYTVKLTVTDGADAQLGAWDATGAFQGVCVVLGEVEIGPPTKPEGKADCPEGLALIADPFATCIAAPPQGVLSGDTFTVVVTWSAAAPPEGDYGVRWRLLDAAGTPVLEETSALSPYATSRWRASDSFESRYDLRLDPTLPAADYTLALNVITPDGSSLWATDRVVGTVQILHRDRRFNLPDGISHPLDLTWGNTIHLRGFDLGAVEGAPGDTLPLTLYWQGDGSTDISYTIFVHLVGPDGLPHGQLDYLPGGGSAPTTSWAPSQVIVDELALPVAVDAVSGTYHIVVGLYDAASSGRLSVTDLTDQHLGDQFALPVEITVLGESHE